MKKLKISKKLSTAIVTALVVVANDGLGLNLDKDTIITLVTIAIAYIGGQTVVDKKLVEQGRK